MIPTTEKRIDNAWGALASVFLLLCVFFPLWNLHSDPVKLYTKHTQPLLAGLEVEKHAGQLHLSLAASSSSSALFF